MKTEFKRTYNGLELSLVPESSVERTMLDELVNDRHQNIFMPSKWHIDIKRKDSSYSVACFSIRRNVYLTPEIIFRYGFTNMDGSGFYFRQMQGFRYLIFGNGVYSVFKIKEYWFSSAVYDKNSGHLCLYDDYKNMIADLHKRKDRLAILQTLSDLDNFLKQK